MRRFLLLYEDAGWSALRPLTDLTPVPALAFGASTLAARWRRAAGAPLLGVEARTEAVWARCPDLAPDDARPDDEDEILAVSAAALPEAWLAAALDEPWPAALRGERGLVGARIPHRLARRGIGRGEGFEAFLLGLDLPPRAVSARKLSYPWNLIEWNAAAIAEDLAGSGGTVRGEVHPSAAVIEPGRVTVESGARVGPLAVLDASGGPIRIGPGAVVGPHTVIVGPCAVGRGTHLLAGFVGRSTIGPQCRIAGEVEECVWQGYANKRHHGFVGHSAVGEWANLGALTTTSDLKNNYGTVRMWVEGARVETGTAKLGCVIGAHVKTGIGTLLPTGGSIGVGSNLFGAGRFAPSVVPAFSWWDGERTAEHRLDPFLETARVAMGRRGCALEPAEERALRRLHERTAGERRDPATTGAPAAGRPAT